jgi:Zn-dependent membrane protease YugP
MSYLLILTVFALCFGAAKYAVARFETAMLRGRRMQAPEDKTGADIAAEFLASNEAGNVQIVRHNAIVSDYFDPGRRRLFLRSETHDGKDLAAWALALHEAAHATQIGEDLDALKWRRSSIAFTRYVPVLAGIVMVLLIALRRVQAKWALLGFLGVCGALLLMSMASLAIEFNANARVMKWLEQRLHRYPGTIDKIQQLLSGIATRELGDLFNSPRYFFLCALPGTGKSRPSKKS